MQNKFKLKTAVSFFIVLAFLGLVVYAFIFQYKAHQKSLGVKEESEVLKIEDNDLDLVEYKNNELGFSFIYPSIYLGFTEAIDAENFALYSGPLSVFGVTQNFKLPDGSEPHFAGSLPFPESDFVGKASFKTEAGLTVYVIPGGSTEIAGGIDEGADAYVINTDKKYSQIVFVGRRVIADEIQKIVKSFKY